MRRIAAAILLALLPTAAVGQQPDSHGEAVTTEPSYKGGRAQHPIPSQYHIKNEGGSDGAGLCVYSSVIINGAYQNVADLRQGKESKLWKYVKGRPGGSYPEKLARDLKAVYGDDVKYVQYYGPDAKELENLVKLGPVGATMNTGALYNYAKIAHMISLVSFKADDKGYACVVDNNDPGKYHWMPAAEYLRRWKDRGEGWAVLLRATMPPALQGDILPVVCSLLTAVALLLSAAIILHSKVRAL